MALESVFTQKPDLSPRERTLRAITSITLVPAFGLLLAHGIITNSVFPALCLLPMGFSAALGALMLFGQYQPVHAVRCLADLLLSVWFFAFLLPSWISMHRNTHRRWDYRRWEPTGEPVLATYGTVPVMVNMAIHLFFLHEQAAQLLRTIYSRFRTSSYARLPSTCPHCEGDLFVDRPSRRVATHRSGRGDDHNSLYSDDSEQQAAENQDIIDQENLESTSPSRPQGMTEREPRPSTDDETARLV